MDGMLRSMLVGKGCKARGFDIGKVVVAIHTPTEYFDG